MIRRLLIANRGEIACRIVRSARALGIGTVAVYSDADAGAAHVALADAAYRLGPAPAADSYLRIDRLLAAAAASGADAVHPGYGFLSENPEFATACADAGLCFVGPPADAIRAMGLKDAAKTLMERAGVPVVPGYHGDDQDPARLAARATDIGYPVMIKARAGGGGKGMRRVDDASGFAAALAAAAREAEASFGDGRMLIEKYVATPRHIEVQVFADAHGGCVYLFERDCSLQRRHQKVIEEAPAPGMDGALRAAMGEAAVRAARAVGYRGAGTVEFIADASDGLRDDRFYFMEMNTRLQVEHPVTEMITGIDLVAWQLDIAAGLRLPLAQHQIAIDGHAVEARLYAEDPASGFLPAAGRLERLLLPGPPARVDSGVREGDVVTTHYDPLLAKIIVQAPDRARALAGLDRALGATRVDGCASNRDFLRRLLRHPEVVDGRADTGLIDRELAALTAPPAPPPSALAVAALLALRLTPADRGGAGPWRALRGWRSWGEVELFTDLHCGGTLYRLRARAVASSAAPRRWQVDAVVADGERIDCGALRLRPRAGTAGLLAEFDDHSLPVRADGSGDGRDYIIILDRETYRFSEHDPLDAGAGDGGGGDTVRAPMPGSVRAVDVAVGDRVERGQTVLIMEAMKMELSLNAPRAGRVAELDVAAGDQVDEGALLLRLEPE